MQKAVAVVGFKKSGKTTLVLDLARNLTEMGYSVAAAKFSHHPLDKEGTDTAALQEVCSTVFGLGRKESMVHWNRERFLPDMLPLAGEDILLVEGGKFLTWLPRVLALKEPGDVDTLDNGLSLGTWGECAVPGMHAFRSVEEMAAAVLEQGFRLPGLDCGTCGRADCLSLGREIVAGKASCRACKAMRTALEVTVNGHPLAMNPFVENVMAGNLRVVLEQLKGYSPGAEVEIRFK
jgi:molybdopterin-guanine dinucleotide biosynthesis protein B